MKVSLLTLLRTGELGELKSGISELQVRNLLGEPDATGGTSRKHPKPSIYLYGSLEIWFNKQPNYELISLWWDASHKGEFYISDRCEILDWCLHPEYTQKTVEEFLVKNQISFSHSKENPNNEAIILIPSSGVHLSFEADTKFVSLYVSKQHSETS